MISKINVTPSEDGISTASVYYDTDRDVPEFVGIERSKDGKI